MTTFAASGGIPGTTTTYSTEGSSSADDAVYSTKGGIWVQVDENTWTMDKDGDRITDVTLVKKGDQWEYLFQTEDPDAQYYGWEESVPNGYKVVGKGERKDPAISNQPDFSITNEEERVAEPEYGSLKLSKVVTGEGADPSQNFLFEINLTSTNTALGDKLKGSITFGDVNFKDGKATVYLKDNDVVELRNIPAGVTWEIKEKATEGYKTEVAVGNGSRTETDTSTGVIEKDVTTKVAYTNTKISSNPGGGETPEDPTGSFKVKKVVENGSDKDEFYFSAALTGLKAQKSYTVNITRADASSTRSSSITSNAAGTAYVQFQLKNGEIAEFVALPIGSNYQIKEDANDYTASYEITDEEKPDNLQAVMSQNGNYESKKELSTQKETLDAGEKALITFTNSKPAPKADTIDIEVEKTGTMEQITQNVRLKSQSVCIRVHQTKKRVI